MTLPDMNRIKELLKQKTPVIWVFSGDSITAGFEHTHGCRSYPEVFAERIRYEMGRSLDPVINSGISGHATPAVIQHFDWCIKQFKPSVVSLMIGTNDSAEERKIGLNVFRKNLDLLVNSIRGLGAIPILHTPSGIISEKAPERSRLPEYVEAIKKVAQEKKTILVDNWAHWHASIAAGFQNRVFKEWLDDPLHPNGRGHSEIARLMFKELSIFNAEAASCGGRYYEGEH